jgi:SAM-dependent methyltransferase
MAAPSIVQQDDPISAFKAKQRETWALGDFNDVAVFTMIPAAHLVRFAGIRPGQSVLDVGTGTGVVAVTAARAGAKVTGLDLTPELLSKARLNAEMANVQVTWQEGDAEALPYPDATFDVVVSQFGHMFAPRPEVAAREMLRVLRPGGTVAFATWPVEQIIGRSFAINARYVPPPPGVAPPPQWGDINLVRERLGTGVRDLFFERGVMPWNALSPHHYRAMQEAKAGPFVRVVQALQGDPARLAAWRREVDEMANLYFDGNAVRCEYLLTRATKA